LSNCWLITYCSVEGVYADYAHDQRKMWEASRGGPVIRRIFEIHVKVRIFLRDYIVETLTQSRQHYFIIYCLLPSIHGLQTRDFESPFCTQFCFVSKLGYS